MYLIQRSGKIVFEETNPWNQKGCGLLLYVTYVTYVTMLLNPMLKCLKAFAENTGTQLSIPFSGNYMTPSVFL